MLICRPFLRQIRQTRCIIGKNILYGQDGRLCMLNGCNKVADAVKATMGPKGRIVLIDQVFGNPQITKDGYTVAKAIVLDDRMEDLGCTIAKSAAEKTNFEVGDGTSASMILTREIFKQGCRVITGGVNPDALKRGIQEAVSIILKELDKISIKVNKKDELLVKVATIAANGDENVGTLASFILERVGADGYVTIVRDKKLLESEIEFAKGYRIDQGAASPNFLTGSGNRIDFENPYVLIVDDPVKDIESLAKFLDYAAQNKRPLFIFARKIETKVLTYLIVNNTLGKVRSCVVSQSTEAVLGVARDVEILTQSTIINKYKGTPLESADVFCLGGARRISIGNNYTIIIKDKKPNIMMENHIKELRKSQEEAVQHKSMDMIELFGKHLASLSGESAIVHVGAATEVESSELKDRLDDSIHAAQAALKEGVLVGGGAALIHASRALANIKENKPYEEKMGMEIIERACRLPCITIADNSGYLGTSIAEYIYRNKDTHFGFDGYECEMKDLVNAGIVDATKVIKVSLANAASVASMLLTTDCVMAFERDPPFN